MPPLRLIPLLLVCTSCTFHSSKQALSTGADHAPSPSAVFVTEEDSGLKILGLVQISEPDHYAVLLERARRRYRCARLTHAQLDFYTDYWVLVSFPIARITVVCEPEATGATRPPAPGAASYEE